MDANIGLPSEILVLCTSAETKEKALTFFEQIRRNEHVETRVVMDPALPAICSLIASEQLGNTVVSERRAQQWSRSTPEHFKAMKAEIKKILFSGYNNNSDTSSEDLLYKLVQEFELDDIFLEYMIHVRRAFTGAVTGPDKSWRIQTQTQTVQLEVSIFMWICRRFKLHTKRPIDDLPSRYGVAISELEEIHHALNKRWSSNADITNLCGERFSTKNNLSSSLNSHSTGGSYRDNIFHPLDPTDFSQLVNDFELDDNIADGLHHLQHVIRQTQSLKNLVDWDSTLGKCTIFYWTCSVLKITGIKHITVRTHYNVNKKDFDKLILALDGHRGDLRSSLEEFYAKNTHLTDPFKPTPGNSITDETMENFGPQSGTTGKSNKRGRPRRNKSPVSCFTPASPAEVKISKFCDGRSHTYKRALLLYRSLMARPLPNFEHIPLDELPFLITYLANEQVGLKRFVVKDIQQMTTLRIEDQFNRARSELESFILKGYENQHFAHQTRFDEMAIEHGLCFNTVLAMVSACEYLRESRCLSEGMNWESPLVTCAVFFWICAILQIPDININALRRDSQASKREFDTMLQLLNNHCSHIRHQLELNQKNGDIVSTRNIYAQKWANPQTPHAESQFSQDSGPDERPNKISKSEKLAASFKNENLDSTAQGSGTFDEIIARQYRETVVVISRKTKEDTGTGIVPGSNQAVAASTGTSNDVAYKKNRLPAQGGADLVRSSSTSNRKLGSDVSCTVTNVIPPVGDGGIARNTRYSTQDYADVQNKYGIWVPHGHDVSERRDQYLLWEEKMVERYGSAWEQNITRYKDPAVAFE